MLYHVYNPVYNYHHRVLIPLYLYTYPVYKFYMNVLTLYIFAILIAHNRSLIQGFLVPYHGPAVCTNPVYIYHHRVLTPLSYLFGPSLMTATNQ